ncbi:hypothetical protein B296_00014926 [Ensete ventricosum]|uniref:Uncharacterized protein n=1 Tax=Ensete ventricosum TaxID=4639 RepID=A0A427A7X3_ENSVE|nr:hypothetical protein B296_00014926 [Ensete ventricosum]
MGSAIGRLRVLHRVLLMFEVRLAVGEDEGLIVAGRFMILVLRASLFSHSSWIWAKEMAALNVYGCRALTSPVVGSYRGSDGGGLRLQGWFRIAVDDSNGFGRDWVWMQQVVPKVVQQNFFVKGGAVDAAVWGCCIAVRGFGDRGLGLEGWLRVAVDGDNRFDRDWVWMHLVVPKVVQ